MADITKVTLAKEKDTGTEYYYPESSSDIIDHQIKDTNDHTTVKKMLDELQDKVGNGNVDIEEIIDARTTKSDNSVKNDLKTRIDADYDALNNKIDNLRKIAIVGGSEHLTHPNTGLFKIADGVLNNNEYIVLTFAVSDSTNSGMLVLYIVNKNNEIHADTQVTCGNFNTDGRIDFSVITSGNEWALYYYKQYSYDPSYKTQFEIISEYGTNIKTASYTLYSNLEVIESLTNMKRAEFMQYPYGRVKGSIAGSNSIAAGFDNISSGSASIALGGNNEVIGDFSTAIGYNNKATDGSIVLGNNNTEVVGKYNFVVGSENKVSNKLSYAIGVDNTVDSEYMNIAIGDENYNYQNYSFVAGNRNYIYPAKTYDNGISFDWGASMALGYNNAIKSNRSTVIGNKNKINENCFQSILMGNDNESNGSGNFIMGSSNITVKSNDDIYGCNNSFAIGTHNSVTGHSSMIIGISDRVGSDGVYTYSTLNGNTSLIVGSTNSIVGNESVIVGNYNRTDPSDHTYIFGEYNSLIEEARESKFDGILGSYTLGCNNKCYYGSVIIGNYNSAKGQGAICIGQGISYHGYPATIGWKNDADTNEANGNCSMVLGYACKANGHSSIVIGHSSKSLNTNSLSIGYYNTVDTYESICIGNACNSHSPQDYNAYGTINIGTQADAYATHAIAIGCGTISRAKGATVIGTNIENASLGSFMCGTSGVVKEERESILDNTIGDVLIVGNGTYPTGFENISVDSSKKDSYYSNAFRISNSGGAYLNTGTYNSIGADYAEFIKEWYDGNPDNEDRVGYMVTIGEDGLLHKANEGDYIIGITSGNPSIVGNADEEYYWRYERDRFNRIIIEEAKIRTPKLDENGNIITNMDDEPIMQTITVNQRKESPTYDSSLKYIERAKRPEWDYVGMRGIVPCRDDGTCTARGFCKCGNNGIATKAESRGFDTYYVIERIDEETISVEVR